MAARQIKSLQKHSKNKPICQQYLTMMVMSNCSMRRRTPKIEAKRHNAVYDLTWFTVHPGCTGPHVDATSVCLELMLQLPPR